MFFKRLFLISAQQNPHPVTVGMWGGKKNLLNPMDGSWVSSLRLILVSFMYKMIPQSKEAVLTVKEQYSSHTLCC